MNSSRDIFAPKMNFNLSLNNLTHRNHELVGLS